MSEIPMWWLVISGIYFFLSILVLLALVIALFYVIGVLKDVQAKTGVLTSRVDEILVQVRDTTRSLGSRATGVAERVESASGRIGPLFEKVAVGVLALAAFLKVRSMLGGSEKREKREKRKR